VTGVTNDGRTTVTPSLRPRSLVAGALAAAVVLAGGAIALWWPASDAPDRAIGVATASAGTPLPDGFEVATASSLVGPAVVDGIEPDGSPRSWFAILAVEGDPSEVWAAYATQLHAYAVYPGAGPTEAPGCLTRDLHPGDAVCGLTAGDAELTMRSVPGDVVEGYVVELVVGHFPGSDADEVAPGDGGAVPEAAPAREPPGTGGPLAPLTVAYEGDEQRYVLVEGTHLVRQYGAGSLTGGFSVVLQVDEDADLEQVTGEYVEQATQFASEPADEPEVAAYDGTTVTRHDPPGGAGGYSGTIWSVDRPPGEPDWIFYELLND
jgi:hypothetical protein